MQALFYIGLFGTFFFVMSGITVGVARTTFQQQLDREDRVVDVFRDIEYAINKVILRDQLSLAAEPLDNMNYILPHLSWSSSDISIDPWSRPVVAARVDENQVIAAFGSSGQAIATVSHFALISGGPDRNVDTPAPTTVTEWRLLHSTGGVGDDVVHTFSTRAPMTETWNSAAEVEKKVQDIAVRNYRQRVEQFSPSSGTATDNVIGIFTNCAFLNQIDNRNGLDCQGFNTTLIQECHQVHQYNLEVASISAGSQQGVDGGTFTQGGVTAGTGLQQIQRPRTNIIPNDVAVQIGQCWRYDTSLQADLRFPTMAGEPEGTTRNCRSNNDCTVTPDKIGVEFEVARDPFRDQAPVTLKYDDSKPDQLTLQRNFTGGGWQVVRDNTVRAE